VHDTRPVRGVSLLVIKPKPPMQKLFITLALLLAALPGFNQPTLDLTLAVGYTALDVEGLVELDENPGSFATDWGQFNYGIGAQFLLNGMDKMTYGAEIMYHQLYWYSVRIPYGSQTIYRDYSVGAFRITPLIRFNLNETFALDLGPEFNFAGGFIFGLLVSANYYIPVTETISIPLKFRMDPMFDKVITVPLSLNAGVRIKM